MADEENTPDDRYEFRWVRHWREPYRSGGAIAYAKTFVYRGAASLQDARAAHADDGRGGWVQPGMIDPHVSALRVYDGGQIRPEELAPKVDCQPAADQQTLATGEAP